MVSNFQRLVLLAQLVPLGWASPIELTARQIEADFETVDAIPLIRSKHDLQQSSKALRKRAVDYNLAQHAASPANYQAGFAILKSTGASFLAPISFGSQSFLAILDTGSADTVS